jgi:hypothetical protein
MCQLATSTSSRFSVSGLTTKRLTSTLYDKYTISINPLEKSKLNLITTIIFTLNSRFQYLMLEISVLAREGKGLRCKNGFQKTYA